ncbi:hypothetical protein ACS7SF_17435 [Ralstonia sp. 25C]|uniref:hypothetical protein n=1 Tax=Ralstonia sp. 25C TaxID=3447363 RepID=UPI003F74E36A
MRQIRGQEAENLILEQIAQHSGGIEQVLAPFDAHGAFMTWLDTIRAVEEFINLHRFGGLDEPLKQAIVELRLDPLDPVALLPIRSELAAKFGADFAQRFTFTALQSSAMAAAFLANGFLEAASGLQTVGHAIEYLQSRRRHLVAMMYMLPTACRGAQSIARLDTFNVFLTQVEYSGITITGLYEKLMLAKVFPDFTLQVDAHGFSANHHFDALDSWFLEPERAAITEMQVPPDVLTKLEPVDPRKIFSAAEVRNNIRVIEAAYAEFDFSSSTFSHVTEFVRNCLLTCKDDYLVKLTATDFEHLAELAGLSPPGRRQLVHRAGDYVSSTNSYAPFIQLGDLYLSTVTLLSRFVYHWKSVCLNRMRRFQIRSGFIFENTVKAALTEQGFRVTGVKRINGKEFDVVAVLNDVIYNVQCKNNLVDLTHVEADAARFARYNRQLDRYYAQALRKEEAREHLLKDKLGFSEVRHVVVSRFPVATTNPRVIAYAHIDQFKAITTRQ